MNSRLGNPARYGIAVLSLFALTLGTADPLSARAVENASEKVPDSYEFKVLLRNGAFVERDAAIQAFLERLEQIAEQHGATANWKTPEERKIKQREVRFLDTSDSRIRKDDLIFRTRIEMTKSCDPVRPHTCEPKEAKVTLKQRFAPGADGVLLDMMPNLDKAKALPNQVLSNDLKFEADYGWRPAEGHTITHISAGSESTRAGHTEPHLLKSSPITTDGARADGRGDS
ncbi:MAG: hypothetical protein U9Q81_03970, partial [Pseudomonadota bacterium]|nr:hypothetical protein [Pseudomonadota bacterium]